MNEKELRETILDLYLAGAKTICLGREEISLVLNLLANREQIRAGAEIARRYIENYDAKTMGGLTSADGQL